ncbi:4-fold beta flower protein [Burkholderia sp. Ac-20344]|uniref:4-fold beta flower protein n=1 Tax=Burkholderia sp. Ac-20344 TaxID=2703890 RepID=UPI00197BC33C|nr:hypothetical protein [Burkholderia sp. Ac-20344]
MAQYLYDQRGNAVGFIRGKFIHDMRGNAIGQIHGTHVHKLSGPYVGELYKDMVANRHMGNYGNVGHSGNPGNAGSPVTLAIEGASTTVIRTSSQNLLDNAEICAFTPVTISSDRWLRGDGSRHSRRKTRGSDVQVAL